jgi:hypothetical protein
MLKPFSRHAAVRLSITIAFPFHSVGTRLTKLSPAACACLSLPLLPLWRTSLFLLPLRNTLRSGSENAINSGTTVKVFATTCRFRFDNGSGFPVV